MSSYLSIPPLYCQEEHCKILLYQLPSVGLKLSEVFNLMESAREKLDIEVGYLAVLILQLQFFPMLVMQDYSVSQTTLNDVFVHFINEQREDAGLEVFSSQNSAAVPPNNNLVDIITDTQLD